MFCDVFKKYNSLSSYYWYKTGSDGEEERRIVFQFKGSVEVVKTSRVDHSASQVNELLELSFSVCESLQRNNNAVDQIGDYFIDGGAGGDVMHGSARVK